MKGAENLGKWNAWKRLGDYNFTLLLYLSLKSNANRFRESCDIQANQMYIFWKMKISDWENLAPLE